MKVTIDSESDLGEKLLYELKKIKHFYVRKHGSGEFESVEIYDRDGKELASGCPWYIDKDKFTRKLVAQYPFTYQELKEIKKVYDYIDLNQGSDTVE
jgi:hypothetical protein